MWFKILWDIIKSVKCSRDTESYAKLVVKILLVIGAIIFVILHPFAQFIVVLVALCFTLTLLIGWLAGHLWICKS